MDASVAAKWVVNEPGRDEALNVVNAGEEIAAPDLIVPELASVFRKKFRLGEMTVGQAESAFATLPRVIGRFVPSMQLANDAMILSQTLHHSVYDCFYLACAIPEGRLVTADSKFAQKCHTGGFGDFVLGLAELSLSPKASSLGDLPDTLLDIARLTSRIEATFEHLRGRAAPNRQEGEILFTSSQAISPAFDSPPYRRLHKELQSLSPIVLRKLIALGWLGRPYQSVGDWPNLWANAQSIAEGGMKKHGQYIVGQMSSVAAGMKKLRELAPSADPRI